MDVLLLHGLGDGPASFGALRRRLEACGLAVRAPRLDTVCGQLAAPSFEALAEAIAVADETREPRHRTTIIGHSLGALVGVAMAERIDDAGLVVLEGSLHAHDEETVRAFLCRGDGDGLGRLIRALEGAADSSLPATYLPAARRTDPVVFCGMAAELVTRRQEMADRFRRLRRPRLYLAGDDSAGALARDFAQAEDDEPGLRVEVVQGAGHWPHVDQPDAVWESIHRWWASLEGVANPG
ncbi:MAG: alpha/beta fold hydrolase [Myxococcota bacterium]